jgi:hypothetical protein
MVSIANAYSIETAVWCLLQINADFKLCANYKINIHSTGNICLCGDGDSKRGHPKRCDVQVLCIADKGIMYPRGIACV